MWPQSFSPTREIVQIVQIVNKSFFGSSASWSVKHKSLLCYEMRSVPFSGFGYMKNVNSKTRFQSLKKPFLSFFFVVRCNQ